MDQMEAKNKMFNITQQRKRIKRLRKWILVFFIAFMSYASYMHQVLGGGSEGAPSIHALCPYGGLESLYALMTSGTWIQKIFSGTFIIFIVSVVLAIVFRRSFCGLICPFGAIQEFFGMLGQKILGKRFSMPRKIDQPLRYLKYIVLMITAVAAWVTGSLWMGPYDPWAAYSHIFSGFGELMEEYSVGFAILILTIFGSMLYDRFFCKYLCPMGAFLGIVSKTSPNKIARNDEKCIDCEICTRRCPVNLDVAKSKEITSAECINCQICTLSCPKEGALEIKQGKKKLQPMILILSVLIIYFGGIFATKAVGLYQVLPAPIAAGEVINIDDLKGYMTLEEVAQYTHIPLEELYKTLRLPNSIPQDTKLKEIKNFIPGFETSTAKERLQ